LWVLRIVLLAVWMLFFPKLFLIVHIFYDAHQVYSTTIPFMVFWLIGFHFWLLMALFMNFEAYDNQLSEDGNRTNLQNVTLSQISSRQWAVVQQNRGVRLCFVHYHIQFYNWTYAIWNTTASAVSWYAVIYWLSEERITGYCCQFMGRQKSQKHIHAINCKPFSNKSTSCHLRLLMLVSDSCSMSFIGVLTKM
jgi:hypothetical protein